MGCKDQLLETQTDHLDRLCRSFVHAKHQVAHAFVQLDQLVQRGVKVVSNRVDQNVCKFFLSFFLLKLVVGRHLFEKE